MAFVFGVSTALMLSAVMFWLFKSISAKTGLAPAVMIQDTEARKVREVTITSSSVEMFNAFRATSKAKVPLLNATACLVPTN